MQDFLDVWFFVELVMLGVWSLWFAHHMTFVLGKKDQDEVLESIELIYEAFQYYVLSVLALAVMILTTGVMPTLKAVT